MSKCGRGTLEDPYEMVQKAYLIEINPFQRGLVRKVIVSETSVFVPTSGWHSREFIEESYKLVILPTKIPYVDWWDGWWESNWKLEDWAWCHMTSPRPPDFIASRIVDGWVWAA